MRKANQFEVKYTNQMEWFQTQLKNYQIIFITRHLISRKAHNHKDKDATPNIYYIIEQFFV